MNSLNSNPKKTMFYSAAQNVLNQSQSYSQLSNIRRPLQLGLQINQYSKEQLNQSYNNSDRMSRYNYSLQKIIQNQIRDRDRSLSSRNNVSFELNYSLEKLSHAYNINGRFQQQNEYPETLLQKEQQKQELKDYLLKQIQEKQKQQKEQKQKQVQDEAKAEYLLKKQLAEMNKNQSKEKQEPIKAHQRNLLKKKDYLCKFIRNNKSIVIKTIFQINQNNIKMMQSQQHVNNTDIGSIRNKIQSMMKQQPNLIQPTIITTKKQEDYYSVPQLQCDTIFIPTTQKISTEIDQNNNNYQQDSLINSYQNLSQQITPTSNIQLKISQHNKSNIENLEKINTSQSHKNLAQLMNQSRLTISQLTQREKSLSKDKIIVDKSSENILEKVNEIKEELRLIQQVPTHKKQQSSQNIKVQHRTTMLMQIPTKNQTTKVDEPKSSQRQ